MIRRWMMVSLWLLLSGAGIIACGSDTVGTGEEGGEFEGDDDAGEDPNDDPPESGESSCSLLDADSCPDAEACTPRSDGSRGCEEDAILEIGEVCDPAADARCVGGALCFGAHNNSARCVQLCDPQGDACPEDESCKFWMEVDGETVGYCPGE